LGKLDDMTEMLRALAPELGIVPLQERLPPDLTEEEVKMWYLPHDGSKWSLAGHKTYASLIAKVVKEHWREQRSSSAL
jgi:hypothetical protein